MNYKSFFSGIILLSLITGCGNSSADKQTDSLTDPSASPGAVSLSPADSGAMKTAGGNDSGATVITPSIPASPVSSPVVTPSATAPGMNPAHGQPGHRCDIAVGAPLDTKPSPGYTPPAEKPVTSIPVTNTAPAAPAATAPGMNPAHGQPGHRCDIAVGSPLNSKPATNTPVVTTPMPLQTTPASPITAPVSAPVAAPAATAPGMNPAHGQPGHRCDIAVGAPLNSPVKKD